MTERSILIHARAMPVYPLIADPIRMARVEPGMRPLPVGGRRRTRRRSAPASAARAATAGAAGRQRRRSPRCATVSCSPGRSRTSGCRWPAGSTGCSLTVTHVRLIEAVDDRRGRFLRTVSPLITGSPDRDQRNADTMESTLEAIKAAAEARTL